jgi:hypothetical protein
MSRFGLIMLVIRILGRVCLAALLAIGLAIATLWRGVPDAMDEISVQWTAEAINMGWPNSWDRQLYWFFFILAWICFLIGWVLSATLTQIIVHWLIF